MYCSKCGAELGQGEGLCKSCGLPAQQPRTRPPAAAKKRISPLLSYGIAAALVVIMIAVGFILLYSGGERSPKASPPAQPAVSAASRAGVSFLIR